MERARGKEGARDALGQGIGISIEHTFKYLKAITTTMDRPGEREGRSPSTGRLEISSIAGIDPLFYLRAVA